MAIINRDLAVEVLKVVDHGLTKGVGEAVPGRMCVEAAVCYALGEPHGDSPSCVSQAVRAEKIALNDQSWSSDQARAKGMRRLAIAQLGSNTNIGGHEFHGRVQTVVIQKILPQALRATASILKSFPKNQEAINEIADECEKEGSLATALTATQLLDAARYDATFLEIAHNYCFKSASQACYQVCEGKYLTEVVVATAQAIARADPKYYPSQIFNLDPMLAYFAELLVQILVEMKSPGCQWLDLAPLED